MKVFAYLHELLVFWTFLCPFCCHGDASATKTCTAAPEAMKEAATGSIFPAKLSNSNLEVIGVGVRRKGPIKVYSVGLYASNQVKRTLSSLSGSKDRAKALTSLRSAGNVSFLLQMNWKVGAEKMVCCFAKRKPFS